MMVIRSSFFFGRYDYKIEWIEFLTSTEEFTYCGYDKCSKFFFEKKYRTVKAKFVIPFF
jgi:hypothetical protein